jgi:hypothetical protein
MPSFTHETTATSSSDPERDRAAALKATSVDFLRRIAKHVAVVIVDFLQRIAEYVAVAIVAIAVLILSEPSLLEGTKEDDKRRG